MMQLTGNKLKDARVALPKDKPKLVRKKGKKKVKLVPLEVDNIKFQKVMKKRGAY